MPVDWTEVNRVLSPIKNYEELRRQWKESFAYEFIRAAYNFSMPVLSDYTRRILGGDPRNRYADYASYLLDGIAKLNQAGEQTILELLSCVDTREKVEVFVGESGLSASYLANLLKYLSYWIIPRNKSLNQLIRDDVPLFDAAKMLKGLDIHTNLDLLQQGMTAAGRKSLAESSGLSEAVIMDLVNRADLSRIPWASKATISNIIGAGYGSLARLANADPEQLTEDFFAYGRAIGKDLRLGNEIENSQRIAKIVPALVR